MKTETNVVYKYKLKEGGVASLFLPIGAHFLKVGIQDNGPIVWFLLDPVMEKEERFFASFCTGEPIPTPKEMLTYLGTTQDINRYGNEFVLHHFEVVGAFVG